MPVMGAASSLPTQPAKRLPTVTQHKIASAILLHRLGTFWARFGVCSKPGRGLCAVLDAPYPLLDHLAGGRGMRFISAGETELSTTRTRDIAMRITIDSNSVAAVRDRRAPPHSTIIIHITIYILKENLKGKKKKQSQQIKCF